MTNGEYLRQDNENKKKCGIGWNTDMDKCIDATISKTSITRKGKEE